MGLHFLLNSVTRSGVPYFRDSHQILTRHVDLCCQKKILEVSGSKYSRSRNRLSDMTSIHTTSRQKDHAYFLKESRFNKSPAKISSG